MHSMEGKVCYKCDSERAAGFRTATAYSGKEGVQSWESGVQMTCESHGCVQKKRMPSFPRL